MNLLRNRKFAVLLTAAVVIFSVLFGTGRSVRQLRNEAMTYFETGANGVNSVQKDLAASAATAANLCTVAERYLPGSKDLARLRELSASVGTYDDYLGLRDTAEILIGALQQEALSDQDAKYVRGFQTELESRAFAIRNDPYNDMARTFNQTLDAFPVNVLRPVLFIDDLSVFS
ncbi:MAG: hypothetical protein EOM52_07705 [Clostridia bacterium]|nr:hypothetical protein [Clostridia bacterium]